jgi:hypothetical protein
MGRPSKLKAALTLSTITGIAGAGLILLLANVVVGLLFLTFVLLVLLVLGFPDRQGGTGDD